MRFWKRRPDRKCPAVLHHQVIGIDRVLAGQDILGIVAIEAGDDFAIFGTQTQPSRWEPQLCLTDHHHGRGRLHGDG